MSDEPFDLLADWKAIRTRPAQECFKFFRLLHLHDQEVSPDVLQQKFDDTLVAWLAQRDYDDIEIKRTMRCKAKEFVENLIRLERPGKAA